MPTHTIDWFLERLEGVEWDEGHQTGMAWCPCHPDIGTSMKGLSVTVQGKTILIYCHSCGARLPDVVRALDEEGENGHDEEVTVVVRKKEKAESKNGGDGMSWWVTYTGIPAETWNEMGCIAHGTGVAFTFDDETRKIRKPIKEISWERPPGVEAPPLWPLPDDELPEHISIWEGESDAGTAKHTGLPHPFAVTKGAQTPLPPGWAEALKARGVTTLTVGADTDTSGQEMLTRLAREGVAAGLTVNVVRLSTVLDPFAGINDLNGVYRVCETVEEFNEVIARATQAIASRLRVYTLEELDEIAEEEVPWLIPELIAPSDKILIAAPQKSLKSFLALELTRSLVTCKPFLKRPEWIPSKPLRVGFIQEEGSRSLWARRTQMLNIPSTSTAFFLHRTGFRFTESSYTDELISTAREYEWDLIIFDPMQRMTPGLDEASSTEMGIVWDEVFRIQQALPKIVCCIVHHANKQSRLDWNSIRGSSRHAGEVDLGIFLERDPVEKDLLRMWMDGRDIPQYLGTGESFEVKYEIDRDKRIFEMDGTEMSVSPHATTAQVGKANRNVVYEAIEGGADNRADIIDATGLSDSSVRTHLERLEREGLVVVVDPGPGKTKTYSVADGA